MIASSAYITDSDWHDIYNRAAVGRTAPVRIGDNVWIGDSAIICKGVTIGENSIIGAGAIVVDSVPPNTIAAGNPAKVVKQLDPKQRITKRAQWFSDPERLSEEIDTMDRDMLKGNTICHWIRSMVSPKKED
jgi:carbonic anhydrase/acetyltransferase-like protein (isoleucine patch superfamily)